jgi:hypothetical protein
MALNRYVVTADVTVPAGTPTAVAGGLGIVSWSGPGPYPVTYQARTPLLLDTASALYAALNGAGALRPFVDGEDTRGGAALSN